MTKPILVAVDGGSGNVAVRYDNEENKTISWIQPALVRSGNLQSGNVESGTTWETTNESGQPATYSVVKSGDNLVDTCDPGYQSSPAHRVLVVNALAAAGLGGVEVIVGETLPADQFYGDNGQINHANIAAKKASLLTAAKNYSGTVKAPKIVDVRIFPEAVPAYYSAAINADMTKNPLFDEVQTAIVMDIGRFTCDIAEINSDYQVVKRQTTEHGTQIMLKRLHTLIQENQEKLGIKEAKQIRLESMDDVIRQGYVGSRLEIAKHKRIDVTHLIAQAASEFAEILRADLRAVHRNLADVDLLLVVGGGANYIGGKLPHLPNYTENWESVVLIPDSPEMAIVRGVHLSMLAEE